MNYSSIIRWVFFTLLQMSFIGYSVSVKSSELTDTGGEREFWRTTYCVAGGLPMEVQFSLDDNPTRLRGDSLVLSDIDRLSKQVDIKIATLLRESAISAWEGAQADQVTEWSSETADQLVENLVSEIAERAAESLGIGFCGSNEQVGSAVSAAISSYFLRAVQLEGGQQPGWLTTAQVRSNGGAIVMLTVSLRLAQIEFNFDKLVLALTE